MFKFFAIVFAAILAVAVAAPKPGLVATAPVSYSGYSAYSPLAYSAGYSPYAATYATYGGAPLAYSGYGSYGYPSAYSAPLVHY